MYPVNDLTRKTLTFSLCSWTARYLDPTESTAGMQKLAGLTDAKNLYTTTIARRQDN